MVGGGGAQAGQRRGADSDAEGPPEGFEYELTTVAPRVAHKSNTQFSLDRALLNDGHTASCTASINAF